MTIEPCPRYHAANSYARRAKVNRCRPAPASVDRLQRGCARRLGRFRGAANQALCPCDENELPGARRRRSGRRQRGVRAVSRISDLAVDLARRQTVRASRRHREQSTVGARDQRTVSALRRFRPLRAIIEPAPQPRLLHATSPHVVCGTLTTFGPAQSHPACRGRPVECARLAL